MASTRLAGSMPTVDWRTLKFDDVGRRNETEASKAYEFQRFAHVKSAVMPERHSIVQRALKRKLENRMDAFPPSSLVMRDSQFDADVEGQLQKAIESERNYFDSVKKCRLQGDYEPVDFDNLEMCGRFIRTGQPCQQSDEEMYPKVSFLDAVSPYIRKSDKVLAFPSVDGSSFGRSSADGKGVLESFPVLNDVRRSQDQHSVGTIETVSRPMPTLSPVVKSHNFSVPPRQETVAHWSTPAAKQQVVRPRPGSASGRGSGLDMGREVPSQQTFHASSFSKVPTLHHQIQRARNLTSRHSNLSAFYSLGRQAASTIGSPIGLPTLNGSRTLNQHRLSQREEPRLVRSQAAVRVHGNVLCRPKYVTNENKVMRKRRVLDCRTEEAVRTGKFGSLQTLQSFYSRLGSRSSTVASSPLKPVLRGRLGSITNCRLPHESRSAEQLEEETFEAVKRMNRYSSQETAIDLSLHNRVPHSDHNTECESRRSISSEGLETHGLYLERLKAFVDRKPFVVNGEELLTMRMKRVQSINQQLVLTNWVSGDVKQESSTVTLEHQILNGSCEQRDCTTPDSFGRSEIEPSLSQSSRLPLKKRRLMDAQNASEEVQQSPSPKKDNLERQRRRLSTVKCEVSNASDVAVSELPFMDSNEDEDLPLHSAIVNGNHDMVDQILNIISRLGMPVDRYNSYKQTPLHVAVLTDQPTVVRRLLEAGSSPNVVDLDGMTSIHLASSLKSSKCLDCILQHSEVSLNLGAVAKNGQTALQVAAQHCNLSAVMSLVNAGAYLDPERSRVPTPISSSNTVERADLPAKRSSLNYLSSSPDQCLPGQVALTCRTGVSRHLDLHVPTDVRC